MTAPSPAAHAGPASPTEPVLVVRTDRRAINRWHGGMIGLQVAVIALIVAGMVVLTVLVGSDGSPVSLSPFVILLLGQTAQLAVHSYLWGVRVALARPLVVHPWGLAFTLPQGEADVGWVAVARLEQRSRLVGPALVIHLHPGAVNGAAGVRTDVPARAWNQMLRRGITISGRGLDRDLGEIRQAILSASGGRVSA